MPPMYRHDWHLKIAPKKQDRTVRCSKCGCVSAPGPKRSMTPCRVKK